ncbi:MAG: beta-galactosidase [Armatimonadetes bacterium]|nr:beta-galactosidase [Armatimonadota bacterium]
MDRPNEFWFGAAYYPEHWEPSLWARDAQLMQQAGFNTVRMGEFAWVNFEPQQGRFEFDWLDRAISLLAEHGIQTIIGTPTATIPAWMANNYPEVMALNEHGERRRFSIRKDYCVNHPDFHRLSMRIVEEVARHYGNHPNVIAFQTDNEYGGTGCRCHNCLIEFRKFLQNRHQDIHALNQAWGTHFWGTIYGSFDEIDWTPHAPNPSHALDQARYFSWVEERHNAQQVEFLRALAPDKPVTHNVHNFFGTMDVDFTKVLEPMDFASWDSYPGVETGETYPKDAWANALVWSMKRKNFVVMEQQSGPGGWHSFRPGVAPGEMSMLAWQSIARGADGILFFRWRTSISGQEQYWHGILNHDNVPRRRYYEVKEFGEKIHKVWTHIADTTPVEELGVYFSYDEAWAGRCQPQNAELPVHPRDISIEIFGGACRLGMNVGTFFSPEDLSRFKAVVLPTCQLENSELVAALEEWVSQGGVLVLLPRCGNKNSSHTMLMESLPGRFSNLAGIEVEEYALVPADKDWAISVGNLTLTATRVREAIIAHSASIIGEHRGGYMQSWPAASCNSFGSGKVWYIGTFPNPDGWQQLLQIVCPHLTLDTTIPSGLEVARRKLGNSEIQFLLNHTDQTIPLDEKWHSHDQITGQTLTKLNPFQVAIYQILQ